MPPSPCKATRTLSVVILRFSRNSAALPACSVWDTSFMNLLLIPTSVSAPPSAPPAAPSATPATGIMKMNPISKAPERAVAAPAAAG